MTDQLLWSSSENWSCDSEGRLKSLEGLEMDDLEGGGTDAASLFIQLP